jgi:hypothetical protein
VVAPSGPKAPAFEVSGIPARLEVGRCGETGQGVAARAAVLAPHDAICAEIVGAGLAATGDLRVRLDGDVDPPLQEVRSVQPAGASVAPIRFEPATDWPLGTYRLTLLNGEQELARWELEIRADATPAYYAAE